MEITPEIRRAWRRYWESNFSETGLTKLYCACGQNMERTILAIKLLSGSRDTEPSSHSYQSQRTLVPMGFQLK